jgi:hypothetical protein
MQSSVVLESKFSLQDLRERVPFDANCYMKPKDVAWADVGPIGALTSSFVFPFNVSLDVDGIITTESSAEMQFMVHGYELNDHYATYVSTTNERVELPVDKEIRVPDTFRWRSVKFPFGATCPPGRWTPVTELDLDMNANTREGKYNNSEDNLDNRLDIPGGPKKVTVLLYCLGPEPATGANSWFCPIIVVDEDGDGVASAEEICAVTTDVVGQCMYGRGRNSWHIDQFNKLQWISRDYDKDGKPTGISTRWEYDPGTGNMEKYTTPKDGAESLDYDGPSDDYYWDSRFDGTGCGTTANMAK